MVRPTSSKVSVQKVLLCSFHCKPRPSGVSLEALGLKSIAKILENRAEVAQNHDARIAETTLRASWFWSTLARFPRKWGIFSGTGDFKVTPDCLGLHWNGERKTFSTLPFGLLSRNIAPLQFKTERVAKTALCESWFWQTTPRFPGTWGVFSGGL